MADREDIDALLIGALYGELAEADRARLDAHLTSHPQDRHALEAMRATRGLLRDAEVATAMVEPPAAVSALLLQEAARRAPAARGAGAGGGLLGFLAGFLRPVMAHPAMASAAALVMVAGVAGALYVRGGAKAVQPERANVAALGPRDADAPTTPTAAPSPAPAAGSAAMLADEIAAAEVRTQQARPDLSREQDVDSYRVGLDEGKLAKADADGTAVAAGTKAKDQDLRAARTATEARELGFAGGAVGDGKAAERESAKGTGGERQGYLEVAGDKEELAIKNLQDDAVTGDLADGRTSLTPPRLGNAEVAQGMAPAAPPPPPAKPATDAKLPARSTTGAATGGLVTADKPTTSLATAPGPAGAAADPGLVAPYNARSDAATLTWARDQHARLVKLVDSGQCVEAGKLAVAIQRRAPDYYQDSVYNDRRFRACRPYADKSRRAADPARKRDLPSPAAADEAAAPDKAMN